jgi:transposase InsO family protein
VSTFYDWRHRAANPSAHQLRDAELLELIRRIHADSDGVYGSPRIHAMLHRRGEAVSRKRVERLMRGAGITGVSPARKVRTTVRNPADPLSDDLVKRKFTAPGPDRLWVTDLTMIPTGEGPLWLASIKDAFSRRIVGWHTSATADTALVLTALEYALALRKPPSDRSLVHHADHGSQYTSIALTTRLARAGIAASMGTVGDSYDNALAENMWSGIKTERIRRRELATRADADRELFDYIDGFYNTRRIQKKLGWRSPDEYEAAHWAGEDLTIPATKTPGRADRPAAKGLSSVAQQISIAGDEAPDTAGVPSGVAGSDAKDPATPVRGGRGEPRSGRSHSPRERRGAGRSPDKPSNNRRSTPERPNTRQRTLTTTSPP